MKNQAALLAISVGLMLMPIAHGQGTVLASPGEFTLPTTGLNFETDADGQPLPRFSISTQWQRLGAIVASIPSTYSIAYYRSVGSEIPTRSGTNGLAPFAPEGTGMIFSFISPSAGTPGFVTEAGLWVVQYRPLGDPETAVTFLDRDNNPIQTVMLSDTYSFAGLHYDGGISAIRIIDAGYYLTDDLQFSAVMVPEPSVCVLLVAGGIFVFVARRATKANLRNGTHKTILKGWNL